MLIFFVCATLLVLGYWAYGTFIDRMFGKADTSRNWLTSILATKHRGTADPRGAGVTVTTNVAAVLNLP
jgi:hypothetical protein